MKNCCFRSRRRLAKPPDEKSVDDEYFSSSVAMIFLALWLLALVGAAVHVGIRRQRPQPAQRARVFLCYQLTIALGLSGILVFVGHALRPIETAARIGWPASPNFQFELGGVGLGFAIAGLLCLVIRNLYHWFGVALAPSIFLALAGLNHVSEALGGNLAPYNVVTAAPDILLPVTLAWLFFRLFRLASPDGPEEIGL